MTAKSQCSAKTLDGLREDAHEMGELKPGDVVSVRGVVERVDNGNVKIQIAGAEDKPLTLSARRLTFIERPAPPEPDWQPGDLAEDDDGVRYSYSEPGIRAAWLTLASPPAERKWLTRSQIPGPLHKLTVTREGEGQ